MTNEEIKEYLAERGFERVGLGVVGGGVVEVYSNWHKQAVVTTASNGKQTLCLELDNAE